MPRKLSVTFTLSGSLTTSSLLELSVSSKPQAENSEDGDLHVALLKEVELIEDEDPHSSRVYLGSLRSSGGDKSVALKFSLAHATEALLYEAELYTDVLGELQDEVVPHLYGTFGGEAPLFLETHSRFKNPPPDPTEALPLEIHLTDDQLPKPTECCMPGA